MLNVLSDDVLVTHYEEELVVPLWLAVPRVLRGRSALYQGVLVCQRPLHPVPELFSLAWPSSQGPSCSVQTLCPSRGLSCLPLDCFLSLWISP